MQPGRAEERDGDELWRLAALQGNGETNFLFWGVFNCLTVFNIVAMGINKML